MSALLTTTALFKRMAAALPNPPKKDDSTVLSNSYEAIALLLHVYLVSLGFHQGMPASADKIHDASQLSLAWNETVGSVGFVYSLAHQQQQQQRDDKTTFIFRIDKMGAQVEIRAFASTDQDTIYRFQVSASQVVEVDNLPVRMRPDDHPDPVSDTVPASPPPPPPPLDDVDDLADKLRRVFVSESAVSRLLDSLRTEIVQKLLGHEINNPPLESSDDAEFLDDVTRHLRQERLGQESRDLEHRATEPPPNNHHHHPRRSFSSLPDPPPPGFDDDYEIMRPPRGGPPLAIVSPPGGGRSLFNIGYNDLHPPGLGPHDPLRGSGLPIADNDGGASATAAGMHPTFDDPLFAGQGRGGRRIPPDGGEFDPQVPPGARFDPLGPSGGPRFPGPGHGSSGPGGLFFGGGGGII